MAAVLTVATAAVAVPVIATEVTPATLAVALPMADAADTAMECITAVL